MILLSFRTILLYYISFFEDFCSAYSIIKSYVVVP